MDRPRVASEANAAILIPAYKPTAEFPLLIAKLIELGARQIVVVDDGSGPAYRHLFESVSQLPEVHELTHAVNLGKGSALKTGINEILCNWPNIQTVVTADADGQHSPADILNVLRIAESNPLSLVMGARSFQKGVPVRSRAGNQITRLVVGIMTGHRLRDTQTGLRAIPRILLPHLLRLPSSGYDFELDMLVGLRSHGVGIIETPIETIYIDGNRSSHFNPLMDSMRIYFVLVRFAAVSILTALLDNSVFIAAFAISGQLGWSQVAGRLAAFSFNYRTVKKAVFFSDQKHRVAFWKYAGLLIVSGLTSFFLIRFLVAHLPIGVVAAKLIAETLLFFGNFVVEREFVFSNGESKLAKG